MKLILIPKSLKQVERTLRETEGPPIPGEVLFRAKDKRLFLIVSVRSTKWSPDHKIVDVFHADRVESIVFYAHTIKGSQFEWFRV
jgi:hypothetical protein